MSTTEFKDKMKIFISNLENKCNAASTNITNSLRNATPTKIFSIDFEDKDFIGEYNRTIHSKELPHIEDENELF